MKLKFLLVPLAVFGFVVGSYADYSKDEIFKLLDKGYSKTEVDGICGKSKKKSSSKWITPTDKQVKWKKAKELCENNGGRLPTIEELKEVVTDCGGEMKYDSSAERKRNRNNSRYQSCCNEKGFSSNYYWSATTYANNRDIAWLVYFYNGNVYNNYKDSNYYVRCVRIGE